MPKITEKPAAHTIPIPWLHKSCGSISISSDGLYIVIGDAHSKYQVHIPQSISRRPSYSDLSPIFCPTCVPPAWVWLWGINQSMENVITFFQPRMIRDLNFNSEKSHSREQVRLSRDKRTQQTNAPPVCLHVTDHVWLCLLALPINQDHIRQPP